MAYVRLFTRATHQRDHSPPMFLPLYHRDAAIPVLLADNRYTANAMLLTLCLMPSLCLLLTCGPADVMDGVRRDWRMTPCRCDDDVTVVNAITFISTAIRYRTYRLPVALTRRRVDIAAAMGRLSMALPTLASLPWTRENGA